MKELVAPTNDYDYRTVEKSQKPLSPCKKAPCGLNDKSLTGHDIRE
jgi:hypothetical protein